MYRRRLNTKEGRMQERQSYIDMNKAEATEYKEEDCVIATFGETGVIIFDGTAGKPSVYCTYRTAERRAAEIEKHLAGRRRTMQYKAERKEQNKGNLTGAAATAKAIREELKKVFPEVKFRVTSSNFSGGNSVSISWIDGPVCKLVDKVVKKYQYGYFNGIEDIYEYVEINEAELGCSGAKYISTSREQSEERKAELNAHCIERSGKTCEEFLSTGDSYNGNEWAYENRYSHSWAEKYQKMNEANEAEELEISLAKEEQRRQEWEAKQKQEELNKKVVSFDELKAKKEKERREEEMMEKFRTEILPNLSRETLLKIQNAIRTGNDDEAQRLLMIAAIEAGIKIN